MGHRTDPSSNCVFRYDPYQTDSAIVIEHEEYLIPEGTLHSALIQKCSFMPYPEEEFFCAPPAVPRDKMARLFLGQLPYGVTDMQLQWLCSTFGFGTTVHYPERIIKNDPLNKNGSGKVPTGCVHAYCDPKDVEKLMNGLHKRILVDDTGIWYATNDEELSHLHQHTAVMKQNKTKRPFNRPYDTVVAQAATSTYVPRPPAYQGNNRVNLFNGHADHNPKTNNHHNNHNNNHQNNAPAYKQSSTLYNTDAPKSWQQR